VQPIGFGISDAVVPFMPTGPQLNFKEQLYNDLWLQ
jgi:hypothetical protein